MAGIRLQLDPTSMVSSAAQAESALERVGREAVQAEASLDRLGARGGASVQRMGGAAQAASGVMGRFGPQMQQVGFQVGDFATQVGAGTSAAQALGQQLPQLLGGFGAVGAVMGAVAAVAIPLGAALFNLGGETKSLTDTLDDADDAIASFKSAMESAYAPTSDLLREFGSAGPTLRNALADLAAIEKIKAFDALRATSASLAELMVAAGGENLNAATQSFLGFERNSEAARVAAYNFRTEMERLSTAEDPVQRLRSALDLRDQLVQAAGEYETMNAEQQQMYEGLTRIVVQLETMGVSIDDASSGMSVFSSNAGSAQGPLGGLVGQAQALSTAAWSAANGILLYGQRQAEAAADAVMSPMVTASVPSGLGVFMGKPVDFSTLDDDRGEAIRENRAGVQDARSTRLARTQKTWLDEYGNPPKSSGGGGGGGANEAEQAATAYDSLLGSLDPIIRADQEFAKAQETVNAALDAGYISAEQAANTISLAREEMDKAKASAEGAAGAWQDMWDAGGSAIDALIAGTGKLSDVLKQALVDMVALITKRALLGSVAGATDSDSLGTIIAKGLFGGFFDNGGAMAIGSVGIVGERGPELVASTSRGAVVTSRTDTAAMRGGGQVEVIGGDLQLSDSGQIFARMQVVARQAAFAAGQAAINETRRNLGGWNQQLNTDGALV